MSKQQQKSRQKQPHYERSDEMRVVVTGMGAITPLGLDVESTWTRLLAGESGITPIKHFDASDYRTQIAGTGKDEQPGRPGERISQTEWGHIQGDTDYYKP